MIQVVISGVGIYCPSDVISSVQLANTFNRYLQSIQLDKQEKIRSVDPKFIETVIGVKNRYVVDSKGILDPNIMHPIIRQRSDFELSLQAEMGVNAAKEALTQANKDTQNVDVVIVACTQNQRAYPSIAIEIQNSLGIKGFGFDMSVACASATFGIQMASNIITSGQARSVLLVIPEITSGSVNFRDRESAFIFGDASAALLIENLNFCNSIEVFQIISTKVLTSFSNNIRCNFGFLERYHTNYDPKTKELFHLDGLQVFRDMIAFVPQHIQSHLQDNNLCVQDIKRFWLHQANLKMNNMIAQNLFKGREHNVQNLFPIVIDEYGNTAAASCIIALYKNKKLAIGEYGVISSFGAGYSIGSVILQRI